MKKKIITLIALFFILAMINQSNQNQNIIVNQSEPKAAISTYWDYDNKINKIDNESLYIDKPNAIMITQSRSNPYFTYDFSYTVYLQRDNGTFLLPSDYSPFAWGPIDIGAGVLRYNTFNTYRTNFTSSYNNKLLYIKSTFVHANGTMEGLTYTILPKSQQTSDLVFPIGCGPTPYCQYSFYSSPTSYNRMYIYDTPAYIYPNHLDLTTHFTIPVLMVSAISTVGKTYIPDFEYQAEIWNSTHSLYGLAGNFSVVPPSPMELAMDMIYNLEPNIVLNSTYYNKMNTRIEVYDEIEAKWIETTYSDIVIRSYRYKLRILDLENNILYEDLNYVNYATTRTITIESFKLQNNAGEMINIDVYGDHGFYQGDQTFDGIDQNTQPSIIEDQSFSYVQNQYQDHNKVLYLNGTATLRPTTTQGNVEFWLNSNESVICNGEIIGSTGNTWTHISRTFSSTPIEITGTSYLDAIDYSSATNYTLNRSQKLNATVEIINFLQNQQTLDYNRTGWYQGVESFDDDIVNQRPNGFTYTIYNTNYSAYVVDEFYGRKNILKMRGYEMLIPIAASANNNFEFHHLAQSTSAVCFIYIRDASNNMIVRGYLTHSSGLIIRNGTTEIAFPALTLNFWNHLRFSFDDTAKTFDLYVNNTLICDNFNYYSASAGYASNCVLIGHQLNYWCYFDNFDYYSPTNGYFINRNQLLNYSTDLNPILEAQNYNHSGHYQGAISFDNDTVNTRPSTFTYFSSSGGTEWIVNEVAGHKKVLNLNDTTNTDTSNVKNIFTSQTSGSIELWYYLKASSVHFLNIGNLSHAAVNLYLDHGSGFLAYNATGYYSASTSLAGQWYHLRVTFDCTTGKYSVYRNQILIFENINFRTPGLVSVNQIVLYTWSIGIGGMYVDALDFSWNSGYFVNRNCLENQSTNLETWNSYPQWENNCYQQNADPYYNNHIYEQKEGIFWYSYSDTSASSNNISEWRFNHSTTIEYRINYNLSAHTINAFIGDINKYAIILSLNGGNFGYRNGSVYVWKSILNPDVDQRIKIVINLGVGFDVYINDTFAWNSTGTSGFYDLTATTLNRLLFMGNDNGAIYNLSLNGICASANTNYFTSMNALFNTTYSPLAMNYSSAPLVQPTLESYLASYNPYPIEFSKSVYPYSYTLFNYTASNNIYRIYDIYNNTLQWNAIKPTDTSIVYNPENIRECFISIHDQQANYLEWEQFKIRINGTLIYENRFYREIGTTWNISIYNQYGLYLTSTQHTVTRDDNYIAMQLIKRSLKVYNQQETFLHVNITYDPNYYNLPYFWSNWLAPKEVKEYYLIEDYYRVSISNFENGSAVQHFSYNLINDDLLLISSSNTLYNVLANINNVNTSINNQFTYVALNFTNTNSQIGNQTILLEINFENQNTTLGQMLLSQQNSFNYYNSSFNTLFINQANNFSMFQTNLSNIYLLANNNFQTMNTSLGLISIMNQNSFSALNTSIDELIIMGANSFVFTNGSLNQIIAQNQNSFSFINSSVDEIKTMNQNTFSFLNTSVSNLYALSENSFVFMNSSVAALTTQSLNSFEFLNSSVSSIYALSILSFEALNSSFDNLNLNMLQNFSFTNSLINQNQLQLMTQFSFIDSNITELRIDIDSRLITLNSTISNLTAQLSNYIVLVNNSIYTAVLESAAALTLQGNEILGNLSMTFVQNDYLTKILQETMFSSLLNWTNVNYNYSIIESQIDKFQFINKNNNDTYQLFLKYQNQIEELTIAAQNFRELQLPASDVEYRVKSVNTGEYLEDWQPLTNQTVELGTYTAPLQIEDIKSETNDWLMLVAFMFAIIVVSMYLVWDSKKKITKTKNTPLPEGPNTFFKI